MENAHLYDDGDEFDECTNEFYTYKHEALGKWKAGDLVGSFDRVPPVRVREVKYTLVA